MLQGLILAVVPINHLSAFGGGAGLGVTSADESLALTLPWILLVKGLQLCTIPLEECWCFLQDSTWQWTLVH